MNKLTVVAENTMQLQEANNQLVDYFKDKMLSIQVDAKEMTEALVEAQKSGFDLKRLKGQLSRIQRKLVFYDKIIKSLNAGYTIIPSVWQGITIAVRTNSINPPKTTAGYAGSSVLNMKAKKLESGYGRYVQPNTLIEGDTYQDGDKERKFYFPVGIIEEVEIPIAMAKPQLIAATNKAMKEKVFDEIQVVDSGGDPMVIGKIKGEGYKEISFLIAWWLDAETI